MLSVAALADTESEICEKKWRPVLQAKLPAILETLKRRAAAGTLDKGACRAYETEFYVHNLRSFGELDEAELAWHAQCPGQDVKLMAGGLLLLQMKLLPDASFQSVAIDANQAVHF